MAVQCDLQPVALGTAGVTVTRQFMREIDHKPGIASGRTLADPPCLEQDDTVTATKLGQPLCR